MRTLLDFSPLHRSSIGFDRMIDLLESAARTQQSDNYPPFDSVKLGDDCYRITMAVAGFTEYELTTFFYEDRPHTALAWKTPAEFARECGAQANSQMPKKVGNSTD